MSQLMEGWQISLETVDTSSTSPKDQQQTERTMAAGEERDGDLTHPNRP
jgi:hypothetical protein